tara:strand:- start:1750 stop:2031 length:282 start_codon:yes stop_codon:yes gene_type:complete
MNLRVPQELKDMIEAAARDSGRSMNAEIIQRLEKSFDRERLTGDAKQIQEGLDAVVAVMLENKHLFAHIGTDKFPSETPENDEPPDHKKKHRA